MTEIPDQLEQYAAAMEGELLQRPSVELQPKEANPRRRTLIAACVVAVAALSVGAIIASSGDDDIRVEANAGEPSNSTRTSQTGPVDAHVAVEAIEVTGSPAGTVGVVMDFDRPLPVGAVNYIDGLGALGETDGIVYAVQEGGVQVCNATHGFGSQGTVDLFIPAAWFADSERAHTSEHRRGLDLVDNPAKFIVCGPHEGYYQYSIWGPASWDPADVMVKIDAGGSRLSVDISRASAEQENLPGDATGVFGTDTGAVMILDDGYDGATVVDFDRRTATRLAIGGSAGDQPYRLWLTGDSLVTGWGSISVAPLPSIDPEPLDEATIFIPSPIDGHVWLIDYPGGLIGRGQPTYSLVSVDGETVLSEPGLEPPEGFPGTGYSDGIVLETSDGILLWQSGGRDTVLVSSDGSGGGFVSNASDRQIAWCAGQCTELRLTDPATSQTLIVEPPDGARTFGARSARFSPDGSLLAAIVPNESGPVVVLIDTASGAVIQQGKVESVGDGFLSLSWRPDGSELFFSGYSWDDAETTVGRLTTDGVLDVAELPFGTALANVVVDRSDIDVGILDQVPADLCLSPAPQVSDPRGRCSFGF